MSSENDTVDAWPTPTGWTEEPPAKGNVLEQIWLYVPNGAEWEDLEFFETRDAVFQFVVNNMQAIARRRIRKNDFLLTFKELSDFHIEVVRKKEHTSSRLEYDSECTYVLDNSKLSVNDARLVLDILDQAVRTNSQDTLFMLVQDIGKN